MARTSSITVIDITDVPVYLVGSELHCNFCRESCDGDAVDTSAGDISESYTADEIPILAVVSHSSGQYVPESASALSADSSSTIAAEQHVPSKKARLTAPNSESNQDPEQEQDRISIPTECMKMDSTVKNIAELEHLLCTLRYWISSALPEELIAYCIANEDSTAELLEEFSGDLEQAISAFYAVWTSLP